MAACPIFTNVVLRCLALVGWLSPRLTTLLQVVTDRCRKCVSDRKRGCALTDVTVHGLSPFVFCNFVMMFGITQTSLEELSPWSPESQQYQFWNQFCVNIFLIGINECVKAASPGSTSRCFARIDCLEIHDMRSAWTSLPVPERRLSLLTVSTKKNSR